MNLLDQILTANIQPVGHTCGIACWTAQEDLCHCSCGGVNHGCMRTADGVQPARSRKIQSVFYELKAVVKGYTEMTHLRTTAPELFNNVYHRQNATEKEINAWPELKAYRDISRYERYMNPVILIWVKSNKYK